jgi:hypothetical protein
MGKRVINSHYTMLPRRLDTSSDLRVEIIPLYVAKDGDHQLYTALGCWRFVLESRSELEIPPLQ